jgi:hypothetical protein
MPPRGIGLKTKINARDEGLVEIDLSTKPATGRLTEKARAARRLIPNPIA